MWSQESNNFHLQVLPPNDTNFVFLRKNTDLSDAVIQAEVENLGQIDNDFSLICRASKAGWYEFRISSKGYYEVLRFDQYLKDEGKDAYKNFVDRRVGSTLIKGSSNKNVFALSCIGNQITVFINGEQVYKDKKPLIIEDSTYTNGTIGFGFLGFGNNLDVKFNWFESLQPN